VLSQKELAFINTSFASDYIKRNALSNTFQKKELAYFLNRIRSKPTNQTRSISNVDDLGTYRNDIQETVDAGILSLNSQGQFNPNGTVTNLFLLAGISRALDYEPSTIEYPEINEFKSRWFYDYLRIGLDKKIISKNELSDLKKPIDAATFVKYASRVPELNEYILKQLSFDYTGDLVFEQSINNMNIISREPIDLTINSVYETSKTSKEIVGIVTPARPFVLNWRKIIPDDQGNYVAKIPKNQFSVYFSFTDQTIVKELGQPKVSQIDKEEPAIVSSKDSEIQPFSDLTNHWIKAIANELKLSGKLDNTDKFYPNKKMTRAEMARYIVRIKGLSPRNIQPNRFTDIQESSKDFKYIQNVVSNKVFKGISNSLFSPDTTVTKIQAIIVASRLLPDSDAYKDIQLPYSDISKYTWANDSLKKAYYYKIIDKAPQLFPKKVVSNAELVSILYKTSKI
ncbi:MAG: S-layer homology domain-containing protein, partial [Candidatus Margulisbacteria bacterium]|nr:S-layer homology domain-containing protein [Candidatus Margulisiibacteriota bacterium]